MLTQGLISAHTDWIIENELVEQSVDPKLQPII